MRLIGLFALIFVLLGGMIFVYERRTEFGLKLRQQAKILLPQDEALVDANASQLPKATNGLEAYIPMTEAGRYIAASGFPSFAKANFPLPKNAQIASGYVVVELSGGLKPEAEGQLRVLVNGALRSEILLSEGPLRRKIRIPLNTRDIALGKVVLSVQADGTSPQMACRQNNENGLVVQILPSSYLALQLREPMEDTFDKLLTAGSPLQLEWPTDPKLAADMLRFSYQKTQNDRSVLFSDARDGVGFILDQDQLSDLLSRNQGSFSKPSSPHKLSSFLGRKKTQTFEREVSWRLPFDRQNFEGFARASFVDLKLDYSSTNTGNDWLLNVKLNDQLVFAETLKGVDSSFQHRIKLPTENQPKSNELRVTLVSSEDQDSRCEPYSPSVADLKVMDLSLEAADAGNHWSGVTNILSKTVDIAVQGTLNNFDAQVALESLDILKPDLNFSNKISMSESIPRISVLPFDIALQIANRTENESKWIAALDQELRIYSLAEFKLVQQHDAPRVVLLIEGNDFVDLENLSQ